MSKKFKSQASSSRAAATAFGTFGGFSGLSSHGKEPSSLTYIAPPPDLSRIADQQLVIAFKNLLKKDEITRMKAVEDLQDHVLSVAERNATLDDGFLDAWVKIYPRLSIDLSRRVRQLAHPIQGTIAGLVGKRIVPNLPKIIGAWIAGIYDNDRPTHRSALDSFTSVFPTEEKRNNVWKIYQASILNFVDDVILHQTALTLSDERTVKRDDAEGKYARVVGAAVLLFNRVLANSVDEELEKNLPEIENLLGSKELWALCYHDDPYVRRSMYILLRSAISREPGWVDWKTVSSAVIGKSLSLQQIGSASELSESLLLMTSLRPQVWTDDYTGKTSASRRLRQYMQKGSQGGSGSYWSNLDQLLRNIPHEVLAGADKDTADQGITLTSAIALTDSLREGLNSREEPRQNLTAGWNSYIQIGRWLATLVPQEQKSEFIDKCLSPLVVHYVRIDPESTQWSLPFQSAEGTCANYLSTLASTGQVQEVQSLCTSLSNGLLEAVKLSSPEQSKDFRESQDSICAQSKRFLNLKSAILKRVADTDVEPPLSRTFEITTTLLLEGCIEVLRNRNGKPYGAAAAVEECVRSMPSVAKNSESLQRFVQDDIPELLLSPSAGQLISTMLECRKWDEFASSFENVVERALALEPEQSNVHVLQSLLSSLNFDDAKHKDKLNYLVVQALTKACNGSHAHWPIITTVLLNKTSRGELSERIFLSLIDALSVDDKVMDTLHGISHIGRSAPSSVREFQGGAHGSKLAGKLLFLTESPSEEVASSAEALLKSLKESGLGEVGGRSGIEILQHAFNHVDAESLSIESLLAIADELLPTLTAEAATGTVKDVLPSRLAWEESLSPFLQLPPRPSVAITSPLGGVVHLVQRELSDSFKALWPTIPRDSDHRSSAFRLAAFTISVLTTSDIVKNLDQESLETLFYFLPLAIQLIDDDLSIENCNGISGLELADQREEYLEIVFSGRKMVGEWLRNNEPLSFAPEKSISSLFVESWETRLDGLQGTSPLDYRVGEVFVKIMTITDSLQRTKSSDDVGKICREARTANPIRSASWFAVLRSPILSNPIGNRICNELVADSTGLKAQDASKGGFRKLALLNIILSGEDEVVSDIPTQRLVFLTKNLIECLQSGSMPSGLTSEVIKTLSFVLPALSEIYGSHWEETMNILGSVLRDTNGGEEGLPLLVSSFRLFARLKSIAESDSNDDVQDAWSDLKTGLFNSLVSTIDTFDSSTTFHQPRDVAVELLRRLITTIPVDKLEDVSETFHLLTAHSRAVQRTAYTILHHYIPHAQEKVSFELALSKTTVSLPDELISLLLEPPTMQMVSAAYGDDKMWTTVRSYLLSWKVVFDHFSNASLPVQEYYSTNIRENNILIPLLEFTFDFLQRSHGKMIDASKLDIQSFEPDQCESAEKETQWLLVHLYYLCLRYSGNMTKNWWIDTKKRIKGPVEAWTEKYISPLVIEDALKSVTDWIATQDANEERALDVKISPKTGEIIASILVDEESPPVAISITLPPAYPLQSALVVGRSRVLVDEKKWKSWLLIIQGVIMFANGNLVDGLLAFRKNVQGALKGHSECAICYSVISTDMQTPNKRCATCKNCFHSVCLFRWFKSSNQSTCPLCRNNFVYV
ncbi:Zinc finger RING-CH-type [Penicillium bovifimosum]|uniref:E3 ubiquitin-protein ligase listerin n=1 Tax=Penicillium bovifimosum TaxID=126998 RepID=A0A9W9L1G9_9EURO|nr:Zinc finger RING-CH-type [Penicillium bovifimosum]KAJ5131164.1 Zinc finger RING-CH-type [Penicillium bovifimosum]